MANVSISYAGTINLAYKEARKIIADTLDTLDHLANNPLTDEENEGIRKSELKRDVDTSCKYFGWLKDNDIITIDAFTDAQTIILNAMVDARKIITKAKKETK